MQGFSHFSTEKLDLKCKINPTDAIKKSLLCCNVQKLKCKWSILLSIVRKGKKGCKRKIYIYWLKKQQQHYLIWATTIISHF